MTPSYRERRRGLLPGLDHVVEWCVPPWLGETGENGNQWYRETLDLVRRNDVGWCFWPWKKVLAHNCPLSVEPPAGTWKILQQY